MAKDSHAKSRAKDDPAGSAEAEAHDKQATSAYVVYRAISVEAEEELERPASALAWSGLAAGLSMGFSLIAESVLEFYLPDRPWRPLVSKLGYSVGFLIVILGRQQLFTENTLTPVLPLLRDRTMKMLISVMRLWAVVLVTNLLGTFIFSTVLARTGLLDPAIKETLTHIAKEATTPSFDLLLLRGVFAGWLLALMVWLLPVAETGRISVIVIITYLIGISKFSHVIAGSADVFYLAAVGADSWANAFGHFILPALIGNILGGTALVAALNYAQVAHKEE